MSLNKKIQEKSNVVSLRSEALKRLHEEVKSLNKRTKGVCTDSTARKLKELEDKIFIEICQLEHIYL